MGRWRSGGTKTSCVVGRSPADLSEMITFPTTDPAKTLGQVINHLRAESPEAVGIAAFGPLDLVGGRIGITPKEGWSGADLLGPVMDVLDVPIVSTPMSLGQGSARAGGAPREGWEPLSMSPSAPGSVVVPWSMVSRSTGWGIPRWATSRCDVIQTMAIPASAGSHGDCLEGLASGPGDRGAVGDPG